MSHATRPSRMGLSITRLATAVLAVAVLALCMMPRPASAQQAGQRAHELRASTITLPSSNPGILAALPCGSCAVLSLNTTNATLFEIAGQPVSLEVMRQVFAANPQANVVISVGDDFKTVQRVWITSALKQ